MIEVNLLPPELKKKEAVHFAIPIIINRQLIVRFLLFFAGFHVLLGGMVVTQTFYHRHLKHEVASLREANRETLRQKSEIKKAKQRVSEIAQMTQRNFSWARLLNALSDSTPKGLWLRNFKITEEMRVLPDSKPDSKPEAKSSKATSKKDKLKKVKTNKAKEENVNVLRLEGSVVGNGQETATISRFIKALKDDPHFGPLFDEVQFFNISQKKIKSFDVYDFVIVCDFKKEKL